MKNLLIAGLFFMTLILTTSSVYRSHETYSNLAFEGDSTVLSFPDDVTAIFERSCFYCHSDNSKNLKAKGKLNFSKWNEYDKTKQISKLDKICEVLQDKKMPKKGYINKNPDKALNAKETVRMCNFTNEEMERLVGD